MSTPQDPRTRHREKARRARKMVAWNATRAAENAEAAKPKAHAKKTTG